MCASQLGEQATGLLHRAAEEDGDGTGGNVRARVKADQPEGPSGLDVQVAVGPGDYRAQFGALVSAGIEQVEPPPVGQFTGQFGERGTRAGDRELGCHTQRQRQPCASRGKLVRSRGVRVDPGADQGA